MDEAVIGLNRLFYRRILRVFGSANNAITCIAVIDGGEELIMDALSTLRIGGVPRLEFEIAVSNVRCDVERSFVFSVVAAAVAELSGIIGDR